MNMVNKIKKSRPERDKDKKQNHHNPIFMCPVTAGSVKAYLRLLSVCDSGVIFTFAARAGSHSLRLTWLAFAKATVSVIIF